MKGSEKCEGKAIIHVTEKKSTEMQKTDVTLRNNARKKEESRRSNVQRQEKRKQVERMRKIVRETKKQESVEW